MSGLTKSLWPAPAASLSQRVRAADDARQILGDDFFGGWQGSDIELFKRHAHSSEPTPGKITDFLGIRTSAEFNPWAAHLAGAVVKDLPIPDDGIRAEAIEYFALLDSLESSDGPFTLVELGASYAPWACSAAVLARRVGRASRVVAIEASRYMFDLIARHLAENDVPLSSARLIHGAVSTEPGTIYFPKVQSAGENGGQAVRLANKVDYIGRQVEYEPVTANILADILPAGVTDLLHVDVQGAESALLQANAILLKERVRTIFVGTHSRKIEGDLLEFFHAQGWALIRERPTRFVYHADRPDIVGWTTRDGGQYWRNPRVAALG